MAADWKFYQNFTNFQNEALRVIQTALIQFINLIINFFNDLLFAFIFDFAKQVFNSVLLASI